MTIGNGESNTEIIVTAFLKDSETGRPAQLCSDYSGGSQTDWFLPSLGELKIMHDNLKNIQTLLGLEGILYWSSSEYDENHAWFVNFGNGFTYSNYLKSDDFRFVRPIRAF